MAEAILKGKIILRGKIKVKTGLHIGGTKASLDIGGIDNSFIRTRNGRLFIPGSSLRGKVRSLLEKKNGLYEDKGEPSQKVNEITKIFGVHKSQKAESGVRPVTLIVRDAYLSDGLDNNKVLEVKTENVINRITGKAEHPREIERVTEGSKFDFEIIFNLNYNSDENKKLFVTLLEGLRLLEDDYLGGSGSRGYGKVEFEDIDVIYRSREFYEGKKQEEVKHFNSVSELQSKINEIEKYFSGV